MRVGLEELAKFYELFQDSPEFTTPIPFLGKSINELVSGAPGGT
jgi:hypothetical protein